MQVLRLYSAHWGKTFNFERPVHGEGPWLARAVTHRRLSDVTQSHQGFIPGQAVEPCRPTTYYTNWGHVAAALLWLYEHGQPTSTYDPYQWNLDNPDDN